MRSPPAAAALLLAAGAAAAGFVDPLDRPAEQTAAASRSLLVAVAGAGGRLLAVGPRGHVLVSEDGGERWAQAPVPVSTDLTSVRFASPRRAFAVGHDGVVLASEDGGRTWAKRLDRRALGAVPDASLLDVGFADERTGFAVGAFDLVVRTDDGGTTWRPWPGRTENPGGLHLHAIARVAGAVWIVGEQGLVLKLDRARQRFRAVAVPRSGSFFGVTGDDRTVLVHGLDGAAFLSRDQGASWTKADTGVDSALTGATLLADGRIVLASQAGQVLVGDPDGARFRASERGAGPAAFALAPAGGGRVVIVGPAGARVATVR